MRKLKSRVWAILILSRATAVMVDGLDGCIAEYPTEVLLNLYGRNWISCDKPRWMRKCNFAFFPNLLR